MVKRMSDVRASGMLPQEFFEKEAREHLREGDLFSYKSPVIPIMTKGRAYGSLSKQVVARGIKLPDLPLCNTGFQDGFIFLALWDDNSTYDEQTMYDCAAACHGMASLQQLDTLVMPILGGKGGEKYLWIVERGIFEHSESMDSMGLYYPPNHIFVTDKIVT